ncbi:MAG TPA: hypothetical protein VMW45_00560 [Dehalococcoidia bacterium]|nr:hypothetical protein [Dehalococcoidia bacterium]
MTEQIAFEKVIITDPATNKKNDAVAVIRNGRWVALLPELDRLRRALNLPLEEVKHIVDDFIGIMNREPTSDEREFWKAILEFKCSQK